MNRKIYLDGELGDKYGRELSMNASSFPEVFKCLEANYPDINVMYDSVYQQEDYPFIPHKL